MKLPRRVPWTSISELEQVCSWIYAEENDIDGKILAVNRISAWRAITHLPHALESTLSILVAIVQDNLQPASSSQLALRQSYSTAIIRLVNGLVDPLQLGAYARSISSIAQQLGLPSWLVELRHAATHEDLPSLDLLREAARVSMVWLLNNYFLPAINPSTAPEVVTPLRPLEPTLKQYKHLLKMTARDASLRTHYAPAILSVMKDVERWITEARVAANMATRDLWETTSETLLDSVEMDAKERWALERLCDALLEKGGLVPLSKKKRDFPADSFTPPKFSILLWTSLLHHLQSLHSEFYAVLAGRIVLTLLAERDAKESQVEVQLDSSYELCLARWAFWVVEAWEADDSHDFDLRKEVTVLLMQSLGHVMNASHRDKKSATILLESLCTGLPQLDSALSVLKVLSNNTPPTKWIPEDIEIMDQRLNALLSSDLVPDISTPRSESLTRRTEPASDVTQGWRLLDESSGWRPCPIGVYRSTIE
ncbi:hypothetical protein H0H81_012714 [Sphagnurus paluster]|uniref:Las1-domain-containing protein n=1 Tax=Sphagnurus paluster TaxID=117069 RepID=A0A9P7KKT5_9AGAR|nr:hypothetical protein H0H81_012714 [Sphagnurus paluster]